MNEDLPPCLAEVVLCQLQCGEWLILEGSDANAVANSTTPDGVRLMLPGPARLLLDVQWGDNSPDDIDPAKGREVRLDLVDDDGDPRLVVRPTMTMVFAATGSALPDLQDPAHRVRKWQTHAAENAGPVLPKVST